MEDLSKRIIQAIRFYGFYIDKYKNLNNIRKLLLDSGTAHLMTIVPVNKDYFILEPNIKQCNIDCKAECIDRKGRVDNECYYRCYDRCVRERIDIIVKRLSEGKSM